MADNSTPCMNPEIVYVGDQEMARVIRADFTPDKTTFITPNHYNHQLGYIVYSAGKTIPRHRHLPLERVVIGTSEVIMVKSGRCVADIYGDDNMLAASVELRQGDVILFCAGGHGFRILEDTILLEVKQGPYYTAPEKEFF